MCDLWPLATGRVPRGAQGKDGKPNGSELPEICGLAGALCAAALTSALPVPASPGDLRKTSENIFCTFCFLPGLTQALIAPVGFTRLFISFKANEKKGMGISEDSVTESWLKFKAAT